MLILLKYFEISIKNNSVPTNGSNVNQAGELLFGFCLSVFSVWCFVVQRAPNAEFPARIVAKFYLFMHLVHCDAWCDKCGFFQRTMTV